MSVNEKEVTNFSSMASNWWNPNGPAKTLHDINPARVEYIARHLGGNKDVKVVDIGCGAGILTESLFRMYGCITGIDASEEMILAAKEHALSKRLDIPYLHTSLDNYHVNNDSYYDAVICMELLEHINKPDVFLQQCNSILKPNGKILLSTINRNLKSYLGAIIGAEHILKLLPKGTHTYEKFIRPHELYLMLEGAGFKVRDISGMHYNPVTRTTKLNSNIGINYMVYATKEER